MVSESSEYDFKSKIGNIFVNKKICEEHHFKTYEIDPCFHVHYEKKIKSDKNGRKYVLFRIDVHFC